MPDRKSVILIEDDDDIRETLADLLVLEGYVVETAVTGEEGLRKLRAMTPPAGLCILDRYLPLLSGEQVLEVLAGEINQPWGKIPVVMLSAAEIPRVLPKQAALFLRKPLELSELLTVVIRYCG